MGQSLKDMQLEAVPFHEVGDIPLAVRILNVLGRHYPGWHWKVFVHDEPLGGFVEIINMDLQDKLNTNTTYGYILYIERLYADPQLNCVMRAGGEILERANLARGKFRGDDIKKVEGVRDIHQPINKEPI